MTVGVLLTNKVRHVVEYKGGCGKNQHGAPGYLAYFKPKESVYAETMARSPLALADEEPATTGKYESLTLVQPQAPYGPHIMTPNSLWVAAARILHADPSRRIDLQDGNLRPVDLGRNGVIGINALGAPTFPEISRLVGSLRAEQAVILGGQAIGSISRRCRAELFGPSAVNGNKDDLLGSALGIAPEAFPAPEDVSLMEVYRRIPDADWRLYLTEKNERTGEIMPRAIAFYLSQGCKYTCNFCAAKKGMTEQYRRMDVLEQDLRFLMQKAASFGCTRIEMYLSNLDLFQTSDQLLAFAQVVRRLKAEHEGFEFGMRALSTAASFVTCHDGDPDGEPPSPPRPEIVQAARDAGLHTLGFGVDGTPELWEKIRKGHNTMENVMRAMELCVEYGIKPETLMVLGHLGESTESLEAGYAIASTCADRYGAAPRPAPMKPMPGNEGWQRVTMDTGLWEQLKRCRDAFTACDVLAWPSPVSHPDATMRETVGAWYGRHLALPGIRTADIRAPGWWMTDEEREEARAYNAGKYDR
jgi:hypothetical protein